MYNKILEARLDSVGNLTFAKELKMFTCNLVLKDTGNVNYSKEAKKDFNRQSAS